MKLYGSEKITRTLFHSRTISKILTYLLIVLCSKVYWEDYLALDLSVVSSSSKKSLALLRVSSFYTRDSREVIGFYIWSDLQIQKTESGHRTIVTILRGSLDPLYTLLYSRTSMKVPPLSLSFEGPVNKETERAERVVGFLFRIYYYL